MSKRNMNSNSSATKRPRMSDPTDFWDDDFDGEAIDDCFKRATQLIEEDKCETHNDVSLLSSYSMFKEPKSIITSTQCTQSSFNKAEIVEVKIKELEARYTEKEGEVSILRSNLQSLRTTSEMNQKKKQLEWQEKLFGYEKENKIMKSELEFKNLEIVNLKQQIMELSKCVNADHNFTQKSHVAHNKFSLPTSPEKYKVVPVKIPRIHINAQKIYPLKALNFSFTFKRSQNNFHRDRRLNQQQFDELDSFNFTEKFDASYVYQELLTIINLSSEDLDSDKHIFQLNKVLHLSIQLLENYYDYLKLLKNKMDLQKNREWDVHFLQYSSSNITEASCICGEVLTLLGDIIPFSTHLKYQLLSNQISDLHKIALYEPMVADETEMQTPKYIILMSNIMSVISDAKIEKYCTKFLYAVMKLLIRIYSTEDLNHIRDSTLTKILKQFLAFNTKFELVSQLNIFVKILTHDPNFIYFLCPNDMNSKNQQEICRLQVFITLLEEVVMKTLNGKQFYLASFNILGFMYNIFKSDNLWVHQQSNKTCECLRKLCKLIVEIVYKNLDIYETLNHTEKSSIENCIQLLNLLTFSVCELTQKYVTDFANFKDIVYRLSHKCAKINHTNLRKLEKLSNTEELPEVPKEKFLKVNL